MVTCRAWLGIIGIAFASNEWKVKRKKHDDGIVVGGKDELRQIGHGHRGIK
jgi:hypothetical protein